MSKLKATNTALLDLIVELDWTENSLDWTEKKFLDWILDFTDLMNLVMLPNVHILSYSVHYMF